MAYTHYNVFTYVHIPTGNYAKTCIELSSELVAQKNIYFHGAHWSEWEKVKTELVDKNDASIGEIESLRYFDMR